MKKQLIIKTLFVAIIAAFLLSSCEKDKTEFPSEYTVTQINVNSGNLTVTIADTNGNPLANITVILQSGITELNRLQTNSSGKVDFGKLINGTYTIVVNEVKVGEHVYKINKTVQVLTGQTTKTEIKPESFAGDVEVYVYNSIYDSALANYNVHLIPFNDDYEDTEGHSDYITLSYASGVTGSDGTVSFKNIPSGYYYNVYVYNTTDTTMSTSDFYLDNYEEQETSIPRPIW
jgi:hypothetical protein